jgi:hypothetical protein
MMPFDAVYTALVPSKCVQQRHAWYHGRQHIHAVHKAALSAASTAEQGVCYIVGVLSTQKLLLAAAWHLGNWRWFGTKAVSLFYRCTACCIDLNTASKILGATSALRQFGFKFPCRRMRTHCSAHMDDSWEHQAQMLEQLLAGQRAMREQLEQFQHQFQQDLQQQIQQLEVNLTLRLMNAQAGRESTLQLEWPVIAAKAL